MYPECVAFLRKTMRVREIVVLVRLSHSYGFARLCVWCCVKTQSWDATLSSIKFSCAIATLRTFLRHFWHPSPPGQLWQRKHWKHGASRRIFLYTSIIVRLCMSSMRRHNIYGIANYRFRLRNSAGLTFRLWETFLRDRKDNIDRDVLKPEFGKSRADFFSGSDSVLENVQTPHFLSALKSKKISLYRNV